jgi:ABC-type transport system involved in multi-copper enzyme maturation permease subunit
MIWVTWRQFRAQAIAAGALIAVIGVVLLVSGLSLASAYNDAGLNGCHAGCAADASTFLDTLRGSSYQMLFYGGIAILYLAPAIIGLFWGAPLIARELETGTCRLSWNQSVTRTRWTVAKLGVVGFAAMVTAGLLSLMFSWWASPVEAALSYGRSDGIISNRLSPLLFAARGVAPLGYAAFAFAAGVTLGVLLRRTLPAMALTLALFAAVQVLVPNFVRPHILPPDQLTAPLNVNTASLDWTQIQGKPGSAIVVTGAFSGPGSWILSNKTILPSGQVFDTADAKDTALCTESSKQACNSWLASLHLRQLVTYQPASRFWPLQWLETVIYLAAAAALGCICAWQVRRTRA